MSGPHAPPRVVGLTLLDIAAAQRTKIEVPEAARASVSWCGRRTASGFAFTQTTTNAIELWIAEAFVTGKAKRIPDLKLNAAIRN